MVFVVEGFPGFVDLWKDERFYKSRGGRDGKPGTSKFTFATALFFLDNIKYFAIVTGVDLNI